MPTPEHPAPTAPDPLCGRRLAVLVVQDSRTCCEVIRAYLNRLGEHLAVCARDGREALNCLKLMRFDLALLDVELRDRNGVDLALEIGRLAPALPIICTSAHAPGHGAARWCIENGIDVFLRTPFEPACLSEAIRQALGQK